MLGHWLVSSKMRRIVAPTIAIDRLESLCLAELYILTIGRAREHVEYGSLSDLIMYSDMTCRFDAALKINQTAL